MKWRIDKEGHLPLRMELIEAASIIVQFKFPKDYVRCVRLFHGCQPENTSLTITVGCSAWDIGFGSLLTLDPLADSDNVMEALYKLRKWHNLSNLYLPIVSGGGGDYLCLDYTKSSENPEVVFWFHELEGEHAIFPVAKSFSELLSQLKPDEE